ncbi:MAG TPA: MarR family transcriptional regulator [Acidimicrobiia bacterium]
MRSSKGSAVKAPVPSVSSSAGRVMARLARQVERAVDPLDLSLAQYRSLALLGAGSSASSALAAQLAVSPPSVTGVVTGLVARGLVERRNDPDDRRRLTLLLTAEGSRLLATADDAVATRLAEIAIYFDDDVEPALRAFEAWNRALDRHLEEHIARNAPRSSS